MAKLPIVITTSVIRSARQGESHGGVYLVDLASGDFDLVIDWNDRAINWEGRGGDRGLRGIAFYQDEVYIAASDELFVYNRKFQLLRSYRNKYLKHCHEIAVSGQVLYLTSTELNSVLELDLVARRFQKGHAIIYRKRPRVLRHFMDAKMEVVAFDPNDDEALPPALARNDLHINNVSPYQDGITISGTRIDALLMLKGDALRRLAPLPIGTHNAMTYKEGVIYNDTRSDRIVIASKTNRMEKSFAVPTFPDLPKSSAGDHARQSFGRGLCALDDNYIIAGSSPSTISVYDVSSGERVQMINLSKDIRNCIHGLEVWQKPAGTT